MKTRQFPGLVFILALPFLGAVSGCLALVLVLALLFLGTVSGCLASGPAAPSGPGGQTPATFPLTSPAFADGGEIPAVYTCDGQDRSPALRWSNPPTGTQGFALIVEDPDLPGGTFTHWVLYNIPGSTNELPEGLQADQVGTAGQNDFGRTGYGGPCLSSGTHRYYFTLYALDLPSVFFIEGIISSRAGVRRAIQGHVLGRAQLMGRYSRRSSASPMPGAVLGSRFVDRRGIDAPKMSPPRAFLSAPIRPAVVSVQVECDRATLCLGSSSSPWSEWLQTFYAQLMGGLKSIRLT